ncbi:hypothetical protein ALC62_13242 [Cyphomyrmex costatus]|uniref:Uncharacterized protein n=1 Tax=Cyphomyrmex costatus TaxID=456900 RepID=A0A195C6D0_9HYME|nr:hypothetical protein ALC62_13242 [Cyphomyrmex costatus]
MLSVINVQRIVGVRDSPMRITARNIGQLPRRKLGKLGVKRNSESAVYNYAQSSALPRSGSPTFHRSRVVCPELPLMTSDKSKTPQSVYYIGWRHEMQAPKLSLQTQLQHQRCCRLPDVGVWLRALASHPACSFDLIKTRLKASRHRLVAARIERRVTCVDTSTLKRTVDSRCNDLSDAFLGLLATLLRSIIECHLDITNGPSEEETERCAGKDGKHDGFGLHCRKLALWHRRRMGQVTCQLSELKIFGFPNGSPHPYSPPLTHPLLLAPRAKGWILHYPLKQTPNDFSRLA